VVAACGVGTLVGGGPSEPLEPAEAVGSALLLHGLTDSPYSMRAVGGLLHRQGFRVVALRLRWNPFFPFIEAEIPAFVDLLGTPGQGSRPAPSEIETEPG
jgi:hypothetical protein